MKISMGILCPKKVALFIRDINEDDIFVIANNVYWWLKVKNNMYIYFIGISKNIVKCLFTAFTVSRSSFVVFKSINVTFLRGMLMSEISFMMLKILIWQFVMCVVGFLRLQWLKYKNYRENRHLITKILSYCEKKIVFPIKKILMLVFGMFWNKKLL